MPEDQALGPDERGGVLSCAFRSHSDDLHDVAIVEGEEVLLVFPLAGKLDEDRKLRISKLLFQLVAELAPPGSVKLNADDVVFDEELPNGARGAPTHEELKAAKRSRA